MVEASQITAGMEVADTQGRRLGTVAGVEGDRVSLTAEGGALHRFVPLAAVNEVSGGRLVVEPATLSSAEAMGHGADPLTVPDTPLFGTSGVGTGFGGSGRGEN
jgi:hypothetical protein